MRRRRGLVATMTIALAVVLFAYALPVFAKPGKPPGQAADTVSVSIGGAIATTCGGSLTMTREGRMLRTGWGPGLSNVSTTALPGIEDGCHGWVGYEGDQFTGFFILDPKKDGVRLWARLDYDWVGQTVIKGKRTVYDEHLEELFEIDGILPGLDLTSGTEQLVTGDFLVRRFAAGTWTELGTVSDMSLTFTIGASGG